ncbi:MAG: DUF1795 domain-containing protein [Ruminococcaceae bacterium]|nr:DUF1795 domain-containing protein [Oscillospiraceae bacterium]
MTKKLIALCLAILLILCATACAKENDGIPEGMKSVTVAGEPFRLYVPEHWSANTASGISCAYLSADSKIIVSARYRLADGMTPDGFLSLCEEQFAETCEDFSVTERSAAILGGKDALKLSYTVTEDGREMTCFLVCTEAEGDLIYLSGYCPSDLWELYASEFDSIINAFALAPRSDGNGEVFTDKNTPEGMEIASAKHLEYRFYVPQTWVCDAESGVSEAYFPESERANVTVTSYSPNRSLSVQEYFESCERDYEKTLPAYERIGMTERTVSGRSAYSYTYRTTVEEREFTVMQTLFAYNEMIYSITYTALSEQFESHLSDVEAMLDAFSFR